MLMWCSESCCVGCVRILHREGSVTALSSCRCIVILDGLILHHMEIDCNNFFAVRAVGAGFFVEWRDEIGYNVK
jgi:hypothetical protein